MKITETVLSIPPYISVAWSDILSLRVEMRPFGHSLIVELKTGSQVEVPNLDNGTLDKIFAAHATTLETKKNSLIGPLPNIEMMLPLFGSAMGHNPDQKETPPLPSPMLEKISNMAKEFLSDEASSIKPPEEGCNCPHCQITRAILTQENPVVEEEEVSNEELKFRTWDIQKEEERLYKVTNPLDVAESYHVFLGEPLGCSCGQKHCEHLQAVLRS